MEKNKQYEQEDIFIKKYLKEVDLESPSGNFTSDIMDVILQKNAKKLVAPKPLISKKIWFIIASFTLLCLYFIIQNTTPGFIDLPTLEFNFLEKIQISKLFEPLSISRSIVYVSALFTIMVFVQMYFLKGYFEKRMN